MDFEVVYRLREDFRKMLTAHTKGWKQKMLQKIRNAFKGVSRDTRMDIMQAAFMPTNKAESKFYHAVIFYEIQ